MEKEIKHEVLNSHQNIPQTVLHLRETNKQLTQDLALKQERIKKLEQQVELAKKNLGPLSLRQKFEKSITQLQRSLKENRDLERQNLKYHLIIQKQNEKITHLSQTSQSYEDIEQLFKDQINSLKERTGSLTKTLEEKKKEFDHLQYISQKNYKQLKKAEEDLGSSREYYSEKSYHALKQQNKFLEEKINQTSDKLNFLQAENQRLEKDNFKLHMNEQKIQQDYEKIKKQSNFYSSSGSVLKDQLEAFKEHNKTLELKVNELTERNFSLEESLKDSKRKETLQDLNEKIPKEAYQRLSDQNLTLKKKFEQTIDKIAQLQTDNSNLQRENLNTLSKLEEQDKKYNKMKANFDIFSQRDSIMKDKLLLLNQKNHVMKQLDKDHQIHMIKLNEMYKKAVKDKEESEITLISKQRHIQKINQRIRSYAKYHKFIRPYVRRLKDKDKLQGEAVERYEELKARYQRDTSLIHEAKTLKHSLLVEKNRAIYFERKLKALKDKQEKELTKYENEKKSYQLRYQKQKLEYEELEKEIFRTKKAIEQNHSLKEQVQNLQMLWSDNQKKLERQELQNVNLQKINQNLSYCLNQYREKMKKFKDQMTLSQVRLSQSKDDNQDPTFQNVDMLKKLQKLIDEVYSGL